MIRVLHIMGCSDVGGISTVVLNYYRFIDRTQFHFDIALTVPTVGRNAGLLRELGAAIHFLPLKSQGIPAFQKALEELLLREKYDAVHVHESETCYVALQVAKKLGIPGRIAHSHTSSPWEGIKGEIRRLSGCVLNYHYASHVIGCGRLAGERVFGRGNMSRPKALVLPNAIDTRLFACDEQVRREVQRELGLEGRFVLGMVGRLCAEKNYPFALELVDRLRQTLPRCILVIAGGGEEQAALEQKILDMGLSGHVRMLGRRPDVDRLYQAFDVFMLTSFTEGYPVAAVEAMASGLPVLLSDAITRELEFGSAVEYLPLGSMERWLEAVERLQQDTGREARRKEPEANGLDIRTAVRQLEELYRMDCRGSEGTR